MDYETALYSDENLSNFLEAFAAGSLPSKCWTHAAHLVMAASYALDGGDVLGRARRNIRKYNEAVGGKNTEDSGYHETLTRFWLDVVKRRLDSLPDAWTRLDRVRDVVREYAPKRDLFRDYYSFDVVRSREARAGWIAPDLCPEEKGELTSPARD